MIYRIVLAAVTATFAWVACAQQEHRFSLGETRLDIPRDASFEALRLDIGSDLGRARFRGDGSFTVWRRGRGQEYVVDGLLNGAELGNLLEDMVRRSVVRFDEQELDRRLHGTGITSHSVQYTITLNVAGGRTHAGPVPRGLRLIVRANNVESDHQHGFTEEIRAFRHITKRLLNLEQHPSARRRSRQRPTERPAWSIAAASDSPRIVFQRKKAESRNVAFFTLDLATRQHSLWVDVDQPRCTVSGPSFLLRHREGVLCRDRGLQQYNQNERGGRPLLAGFGAKHSAIWTADATKMAISVRQGDGDWVALVLDRAENELARFPGAKPLSWSPDGRFLHAVRYGHGPDRPPPAVQVFELGREEGRHIVTGGAAAGVSVSPDGRWLAWKEARHVGGHREMWLQMVKRDRRRGTAAKRAEPRFLTRLCGAYDWSPDSRAVVFVNCDNAIASMSPAGANPPQVLFRIDAGPEWLMSPNWSPDGRTVVFHAVDPLEARYEGFADFGTGEIWIMGKDGTDPRKVGKGSAPLWLGESSQPQGIVNR